MISLLILACEQKWRHTILFRWDIRNPRLTGNYIHILSRNEATTAIQYHIHRHTSFNLLVVENTSWAILSSWEMRIFSAIMGLWGPLGGSETSSVVFVLIFSASTGMPTYGTEYLHTTIHSPVPQSVSIFSKKCLYIHTINTFL